VASGRVVSPCRLDVRQQCCHCNRSKRRVVCCLCKSRQWSRARWGTTGVANYIMDKTRNLYDLQYLIQTFEDRTDALCKSTCDFGLKSMLLLFTTRPTTSAQLELATSRASTNLLPSSANPPYLPAIMPILTQSMTRTTMRHSNCQAAPLHPLYLPHHHSHTLATPPTSLSRSTDSK